MSAATASASAGGRECVRMRASAGSRAAYGVGVVATVAGICIEVVAVRTSICSREVVAVIASVGSRMVICAGSRRAKGCKRSG